MNRVMKRNGSGNIGSIKVEGAIERFRPEADRIAFVGVCAAGKI